MDTWSAIITISALAIPTIATIITTAINNKHQMRIKRIEDFEKQKVLAIQEYIKSVSSLINNVNDESIKKYYSSLANVYLYVAKNDCLGLEQITDRININESKLSLDNNSYKWLLSWVADLGKSNIANYNSDVTAKV